MADWVDEFVDKRIFLAEERKRYCMNCDRRKGLKKGKMRFLYDIGDAPCRSCGIDDVLDDFEDIPAADVQPVRHGRWISERLGTVVRLDKDGCPVDTCHCSECGEWLTASDEYAAIGRYCPNCGAKMDTEEREVTYDPDKFFGRK